MSLLDSFLESPCLTSIDAVNDALIAFETTVSRESLEDTLNLFIEKNRSHYLPLLFSNINEHTLPLQQWIIDSFPLESNAFLRSVHYKLLLHFSDFFFFSSPISFDRETELDLSFRHRMIHKVSDLLECLSTLNFVDESPIRENLETPEDSWFVRQPQKQRKKMRKAAQTANAELLDKRLFEAVEYEIPNSRKEANDLVRIVLNEQRGFFESYLAYLHIKDIVDVIKERSVVVPESATDDSSLILRADDSPTLDVVDEVPAAYPKVQPLKSALYFDTVAGFGEWTILINQNAHNDLRIRHKKDKTSFDIIVKKIKELSNGHFSPDNQKRLKGVDNEVPIFEAKMTGDLRLVYQIDVVATGDEREQQAVKIFGIYTHAQMDYRLWQSIGRHIVRKGKEYRERCLRRTHALNSDEHTFIPESFPPLLDVQEETDLPSLLVDDTDPVHSRFLMEKYVVFSQPLLNTIMADVEATFPHLVSSQEKVIIEHPYSCYVIGRSGTGKTTTLLFKMLLIERTSQLTGGDAPKPRQIFVTQSRILAKKVEQYFVTLVKSLAATNQSLEELCQLRASRQHLLLDDEDEDMIDVDDLQDWSGDLPSKFSELRDEHFPLFTTFNGLCAMIEADMADTGSIKKTAKSSANAKLRDSDSRQKTALTYDGFLRDYWPHFTQSLVKHLDPALVFSEFIGVIKGSEETLNSDVHYLGPSEYLNISARNQSTFAEDRGNLYALFKAYLKMKKTYGDTDGADRTHAILDYFTSHGIPGQKVDHLYVDEVQDNLLIDTLVLRALCHDPNGLFWAGDTAQTISVGSSFRFNALKAFQWRLEQKRSKHTSLSSQCAVQPEIFQLAVNYRSHAGIVNCAHSVIDLISHFWKDSIDKLAPEKGVVDGLKPVFFVGWDECSASLEHFLFGDSGNRIEFGAQQCILVRDDDAREKLRAQVGEDIGLIMTVYESKGLEFNDVLLYNFFANSPAELSQWRVVLNALEDEDLAVPDFDRNRSRYASICSELKFLYVAITRARENIWIVDSSDKCGPMRRYWSSRDLVRNLTPEMDVPKLATSSTPEEWDKQGRNLFQRKKYAEAKHCFERAHLPERAAIANAYILRTKAQAIPPDTKANRQTRHQMFCSAAEAFDECSESASYKRRLDFLRLGGDCYKSGDELILAARAYQNAKQFTDAVICYRDISHFDEAIDIVKSEANSVDQDIVDNVTRLAKLFYFNEVQFLPSTSAERKKKLHQACDLFDDVVDVLDYLDDRDLDIARAAVLAAHGRYEEAADLCLAEGKTLEAIELLLKIPASEKSAQKARDYILKGLWQQLSFGVMPESLQPTSILRLLELASRANNGSRLFNAEIKMFQAIMSKSIVQLRQQANHFLEANNIPAAILCFDHYYGAMPSLSKLSVFDLTRELKDFLLYIRLLSSTMTAGNPQDSDDLAKLFAFQRLSESQILLSKGSYLHSKLGDSTSVSDQDSILPPQDLLDLIRKYIGQRLRNRILKENSDCKNARAIYLCLNFSLHGSCNRNEKCTDAHVEQSSFDVAYYNARIRVHLQQVLILKELHALDFASESLTTQRKFWLIRLYEVLFPPSHLMGNHMKLDLKPIPEAERACHVIRDWVRHLVYTLSFRPLPSFLSDLLRLTFLALFFDKYASRSYLHRGGYTRFHHPHALLRNGASVPHELVGMLEGLRGGSLVAGIFSLRHVITAQVPVDLGIFCDTLDRLCRSLIISGCAKRDRFLNNMTLPRSWLWEPIDIIEARRKDVGHLHMLVQPMGDMLEQIYTGGDSTNHWLYVNRTLRNHYISRICRAICLLGYNLNVVGLRETILVTMKSLRRDNRILASSYRKYVHADSWDSIAIAVRQSTTANVMDEMVQVFHRSRLSGRVSPLTGVRQIIYDTLDHLPAILGDIVALSKHTLNPPRSRLNPAAAVFVPRAGPSLGSEKPESAVEETDENDDEQAEDVEEQVLPTTAFPEVVEEIKISEPTEEEHSAALSIQVAYKTYRNLKKRPTSQLVEIRDRFWRQCMMEVHVSVPPGLYRKMLLGPLPHVWAVLEVTHARILDVKHNTRKRMGLKQILNGEEWERLDKQLTRIGSASKEIKKFQESLKPKSQVHLKQDCSNLRGLVSNLGKFLEEGLPFELPLAVKAEYECGYKGIVMEKAVHKKPVKPELNTEDLYLHVI
ncbi:hypothetical protein K435DRAFT_754482 [Dendrothele bispora CBS 962.96]|uniref:UvrD-like helicase ATP-binding domain-containing protein n=1 Tax=Dendrothele bispora (strain CBS 962.96) TaxID=1314807 RepID=A0A4S8M4G8_DENBC|nr:hypothetical protein K435DRAFT_754482 [Dendrothele bispora CBS 962.96]